MHIDIIEGAEEIELLNDRWEELAFSDRLDGFFRNPRWYRLWCRHVRPDAEPFVVVARGHGHEVVGIAPLCRVSYRDLGFRLTAVVTGGREIVSGDFLDYPILPDARAAALPAMLERIWTSQSTWDLLIVGEVLEGGELHQAVKAFAEREGVPLRVQEERVCPYIDLPPTYEEYLRGLSPKMRYEMRRDTRDLLEKHGARITVHSDDGDEVRDHVETLIRLHLAHWRHVNNPGTLGRPELSAFLKALCPAPSSNGRTRIYVLHHQDRPVAAVLVFWYGDSALFYQTGWDPAAARLSPGLVLVGWSIRDAIENGFKRYDFLRGDEGYKMRLTKSSRRTITLLLARTFLARKFLNAAQLKDSVKRLVSPATPPASTGQNAARTR